MVGALAIGMHIEGEYLRAAVIADDGTLLARDAVQADVRGSTPIDQMKHLLDRVASTVSGDVVAIGISLPEGLGSQLVTLHKGGTHTAWYDASFRERLIVELPLVPLIESEGIAATYGEWKYGAGAGLDHMIYVAVGDGITGGGVVDNRLLRGRHGLAGNAGRLIIAEGRPGSSGCFEALASGKAMAQAAARAAAAAPDSLLARWTVLGDLSAAYVIDAAREGDKLALNIVQQEAEFLGTGFRSLIHLFGPQLVVMGGAVSEGFDLMEKRMHEVINLHAMPQVQEIRVVPAALGTDSRLVGAAALALADATRVAPTQVAIP